MIHLLYLVIISMFWAWAYTNRLDFRRSERRNEELIAEISRLNKHVIRIHKKFMWLATEEIKNQPQQKETK